MDINFKIFEKILHNRYNENNLLWILLWIEYFIYKAYHD